MLLTTTKCFRLLAFLFITVDTGTAQRPAPKVIWQESQAVSVQLGVRDKSGALGSYEVVFEVSVADGRKATAQRRVTGSEFGDVSFPDDFPNQASIRDAGTFLWRALVGGKVIAHGSFRWTGSGSEAKVFQF